MTTKTNNFVTRFKGDDRSLQRTFQRTKEGFRDLGKMAKGVGIGVAALGAAGALAGVGLAKLANRQSESLDALGKQSEKLKLNINELNTLGLAAEFAGTTQEKVTKSYDKFQTRLGDALRGKKGPLEAFDEINKGLIGTLAKLHKEGKKIEAFEVLLVALDKMKDEGKQSSVGIELLGKSWRDTVNVIRSDSAAFTNLQNQLSFLGLIFTPEMKQNNAEMQDAFTSLGFVLKTFSQQLTATFSPTVTKFVNDLNSAIGEFAQEYQGYDGLAAHLHKNFQLLIGQTLPRLANDLGRVADQLDRILELVDKANTAIDVGKAATTLPRAALKTVGQLVQGDTSGAKTTITDTTATVEMAAEKTAAVIKDAVTGGPTLKENMRHTELLQEMRDMMRSPDRGQVVLQ